MGYSRLTINVDKIVNTFNEKLQDPEYTQDQKKLMCDLLEKILYLDAGYSFNYVYWITHGKAQWVNDGCPEIKLTEIGSIQSVNSVFVGETINEVRYCRRVIVDIKYTGNEEYTRRYHA